MKKMNLRTVIFLALCCDMGLFAKKLIIPFANVITDALHIPGGIGTSFSLMFLVVAAVLMPYFGCGTIMAGVGEHMRAYMVADDEYRAEVSAQEIAEENRVYLMIGDEPYASALVFGDQNSKRNVSGVIRLVVE